MPPSRHAPGIRTLRRPGIGLLLILAATACGGSPPPAAPACVPVTLTVQVAPGVVPPPAVAARESAALSTGAASPAGSASAAAPHAAATPHAAAPQPSAPSPSAQPRTARPPPYALRIDAAGRTLSREGLELESAAVTECLPPGEASVMLSSADGTRSHAFVQVTPPGPVRASLFAPAR